MTDSLLRSLRERVLDEGEPLAGLLRKCLLLGAETGSVSLRDWARLELNGYVDESSLPDYRKISGVPMSMDSMSGNTWATGQTITRMQLPASTWQYVPEYLFLTQPIEEIGRLAQEKTLRFKPAGLAMAQSVWNGELGPFQSIVDLSYVAPGSVFAGLLGQVRTKLVDLIADLTMATPLTKLPRREDVDAAMIHRIGNVRDVYATTLVNSSGPTAVGSAATASAGLDVDAVLALLSTVQHAADVDGEETSEIKEALAELRDVLTKDQPDTGEVIKRAGKLRAIADKLGVAAISSATSSAVTTLTGLALKGAFG
jgi:hypothetical protein